MIAERGKPGSAAAGVHGAALLVSAFLLFWIQPLLTRMALPRLGGVPAVWTTVMLFFQAALLAGYLYAHALSRLRPRRQLGLHAALLALAGLFLPPLLRPGALPPAASPALWLLTGLGAAAALPAVALAGTAPLLQAWYARSGRAGSQDPYFLYAASNAGSLAALIGFPLLIEPLLSLRQQAWAWSAGFALLAALILLCGRGLGGSQPEAAAPGRAGAGADAAPPAGAQARWLLLAAAPASLLLGVTTHLTTDVAAAPLLWVVPLALYLLTYVMAFSRRALLPRGPTLLGQATAVAALAVVVANAVPRLEKAAALFPVHLAAFFLTALVCHRELAHARPPARHLTRFYLLLAAGGVLGGAFNALLAPVLFRSLAEYPLVLVLACLLRPRTAPAGGARERALDLALPVALLAALLVGAAALGREPAARLVLLGAAGAACLLATRRPLRFALCLGALVAGGRLTHAPLGQVLAAERNFFGPVQVIGAGASRILYHGKTIHGAQVIDAAHRRTPLAYYTAAGPLGDVFRLLGPRLPAPRIAVVGLGAGALAAYGRDGQEMTFLEVNPAVARMAADPRLFTYLADAAAAVSVRVVDGRLGLAAARAGEYGLIVLDAFNSDAVPVHLLTREAVALYLAKLAPGGVLVFNVTNDYLDLEGVLGKIAAEAGLAVLVRADEEAVSATEETPLKLPSDWMALARAAEDLGPLAGAPGWRAPRFRAGGRPWSDDRAGVVAALKGF
jgi:hypothetical protein